MPGGRGSGGRPASRAPTLLWPGKPAPAEILDQVMAYRPRLVAAERLAPERPGGGEPNLLFWGDNLHVGAYLLEHWRGRIDLIYIDPPFGLQRTLRVRWGAGPSDPVAYHDRWPDGLTGYLRMLYPRLVVIRELLSDRGSLYVHVGPQVAPYVRILLDELFGLEGFRNEIVWRRDVAGKGGKRSSPQWPRNTESILFYTRRPRGYHFEQPTRPLSARQAAAYRLQDPDGRRFRAVQLGNYTEASIQRLTAEGRIYVSPSGKRYKKYYLEEATATVDGLWTDLPGFGTRTAAREQMGYPGQKPEALLERIVLASSRPGDWVADFFCGAGTTLAVADRLGRRWIGCDLAPLALQRCRRRLAPAARRPVDIYWEASPRRCGIEAGPPPVRVEARRDGSTLRIRLVPLDAPEGPGAPGETGQAPPLPSIDGWAVGTQVGGSFQHRWMSFAPRRRSDPPLELEARLEVPAGGQRLAVQVADPEGRLFRFQDDGEVRGALATWVALGSVSGSAEPTRSDTHSSD